MQNKNLGFLIAASVALVLIFSLNGVSAYEQKSDESMPFKTDMTDRTMLKEILVNQQKTISLLNEIKASLDKKK